MGMRRCPADAKLIAALAARQYCLAEQAALKARHHSNRDAKNIAAAFVETWGESLDAALAALVGAGP